ncbi:MAG: hypothetical protein ACR2PH_16915 [Desulfobulbia bacterium]
MLSDYTKYDYLYPPRPEKKIPASVLGFYEKRGWHAQVKKNGTCNIIFVGPDGVLFKTRHNDDHRQWTPNKATVDFFKQFPAWTVFVAELMHNKTKHIKDVNYINDILVYNGEYLVGKTYAERQELLQSIIPACIGETYSHNIINENIWVAKNWSGDLTSIWDIAQKYDEDEGLVLKRPNSKLTHCFKNNSNSNWLVKCRKGTKNYGF